MCVYIYVCVYICVCIYMCVYIYICMCVYMCVCIYTYIYVCVYIYMCVCIHYIYMYIYMCVYVCIYMCVCVYVYIYMERTQKIKTSFMTKVRVDKLRESFTQLSIPTHAQLQRHRLKFIKNLLKNSYMFRSSTIFRELQCPR